MKRNIGQTFVMMAIALPAFIGAMGFAVDSGCYYWQREALQEADDAAVLAGAHCMPDEKTCTATSTATSYVSKNGIPTGQISSGPTKGTSSGGNPTLSMTLQRTVNYTFARLVGVPTGIAQVTSKAEIGPAGLIYNPAPIGMQFCGAAAPASCFSVGSSYTLAGVAGTAPGNWGPVIYPQGAAALCPSASCSSDPTDSNTGCSQIKAVAGTKHSPGILTVGQVITIPLVDWGSISGTKQMPVYGFANFQISAITPADDGCSTSPTITGSFINEVVSGSIDETGGANDLGAFAEKLIQ